MEGDSLAEESTAQNEHESQRELFAAAVLREEKAGENAYEKVLRERAKGEKEDASGAPSPRSRARNALMREQTMGRDRSMGRAFMQQENTAARASALM